MNEEIKEIIRLNCDEEIDVKYFAKDDSLVDTTMDYSQLLDYITNLQKEIKRLNNIIDKAIHYINLNQDSKSLCLNYAQLKALRGILRQDEFYLRLFEEQLKELKGSEEE